MPKKKVAKKQTAPPSPPKPRTNRNIETEYFEEITFTCPVRGLVKQKVKVKKLKARDMDGAVIVKTNEAIIEGIDKEDIINICTEEELEVSDD